MDEGRKRELLIAASILAARKLAQYEPGARVPATICAIADAIRWAEQIMAELIGGGPQGNVSKIFSTIVICSTIPAHLNANVLL
jgi:hypothetical protein